MTRRSAVALGLAGIVIAAGAAGCRESGEPDPKVERLVVVTPHWEGIRREFGQAFARHMAARGRSVQVVWLDPGGTSACLRLVRARARQMPGRIGIDLFFGGGVEPHLKLASEGLLDPIALPPETAAALPRSLSGVEVYDPEAGWYGACLTTFGIVYNRELLRRLDLPEPRSFVDLGEPWARTWLALADPRMSGTVHMIYEIILQGRGWDEGYRLLARMSGNARRFYHHASEVPIEVGAGQVAIGVSLDSYAWAQVEQLGRDSLGFLAPEGETVVNPDAISVLDGAPNRELAVAFVEFVLSPEGQGLWMLPRGAPGGPERYPLARIPVRPDVSRDLAPLTAVTYDPFARHSFAHYDPALGSARWSMINALLGTTLIDLHRDLADAWEEVLAAGRPPEAEEVLTRPPIGEAALLELARADDEGRARQETLGRWSREARERYARAREIARATRTDG